MTSDAAPRGAFTARLPFEPRAARAARGLVEELLEEHAAPPSLRQDAALVVHELVINSVLHGRPYPDEQIELRCSVADRQLEITVGDRGSAGTVAVRHPDADTPSGRGLAIVAALSSSWSVDRSDGTRVSARLAL